MGSNMHSVRSDFHLKNDDENAALNAIKSLAGQETIRGGLLGPHFSYVQSSEEFLNAETFNEAMRIWRWECKRDQEGRISGVGFTGENSGDEEILFGALAPHVEPGSFVEMCGEDGNKWRWVFNGQEITTEEAG